MVPALSARKADPDMARRRKSNRSSITEVSKEAGVSIATVSRVINGHPHVSPETVSAVHAAMEKTGYRVNGSIRQRAAGLTRTGNIAVLFPDVNQEALRTPLSGRLMHGIDEALRRSGLTMIVTGLQPDSSPPACMIQRKVDGVIIRGSRQATEMKTIYSLMPCVWVFEAGYQPSFDLDMVCEDNAFIGAMAARRLFEKGHRKMAVLNLEPDHDSLRVRRMFFVEEAERLGVAVQAFNVSKAEAGKAFDKLAGKANRPTGIFVPGTDACVMDTYRGLEERGVLIGRDMEMISVNNDTHRLWALNPTLTNIDIHPEHIGQAAVDALLFRLGNPQAARRRVIISPSFQDNPAASSRASNGKVGH